MLSADSLALNAHDTGPVIGYPPPFYIQQLRRIKRLSATPLAAPPLSYPSEVPWPSRTSNVTPVPVPVPVPVPQEDTMGPTQVNQQATKIDLDQLSDQDQDSSCTCTICQRELHSPMNMGSAYADQELGFHREDVGKRSSRHKLKRCTAMRRTGARSRIA